VNSFSDSENEEKKDEDESEDDEFETVKAAKPRGFKKQSSETAQVDPRFPASDPSKVKVILKKENSKVHKKKTA